MPALPSPGQSSWRCRAYEPGRSYLVGAATVVADGSGQLQFTMELGSTAEQYTASSDLPGPRPRGPKTSVTLTAR